MIDANLNMVLILVYKKKYFKIAIKNIFREVKENTLTVNERNFSRETQNVKM